MLRYKEIKLMLKDLIAQMNDGDKLPSRNILSRQLDSSRVTIDKAIRELEEEGILTSKFGSGTYVAKKLEGMVLNTRNWCLIVPDVKEAIYAKKVWEVMVSGEEVPRWQRRGIVANVRHEGKKVVLRVISDETPDERAVSCGAVLEDLYLYYFGAEE